MNTLRLDEAGIERGGRWLLRGATLALGHGCLTALIGPNGSGKTTTLRLLSGVWPPSEGQATLDGRDLRGMRRRELARRIALAPQESPLDFDFTVREAVMMGRHPHLGPFERERACDFRAVEEAMRRTDITQLAARPVTELSGGERQRVVIARSLATEAETILVDEPTAHLDIAHGLAVLHLCRALADEGRAVVLAIHDLNAATRYADELVVLCAGRIVARGAPAEVLTDATLHTVFGVRAEHLVGAPGRTAFLFHLPSDGAEPLAEEREAWSTADRGPRTPLRTPGRG
ncbi:MAG: ABC transporter ATP-binding protein [Gammaproteobacteria bacterium]